MKSVRARERSADGLHQGVGGLMIAFALLGCMDTVRTAEGIIYDGPYEQDGGVVGAELTFLNDQFEVFSTTTTVDSGRFSMDVPRGEAGTLVVEAPGYDKVHFSATIGQTEVFEIPNGEVFAWSNERTTALTDAYAGCPGIGEPGGKVHGEMRLARAFDDNGVSPIVTNGYAFLVNENDILPACYLGEDGLVYDPLAEDAGAAGQFAFFGVPPGIYSLVYGYFVTDNLRVEQDFRVHVPDDGIVPLFPAWVELYQ